MTRTASTHDREPRPVLRAGPLLGATLLAFLIVAIVSGEWIILASLGALLVVVGCGLALGGFLARQATAHDPALDGDRWDGASGGAGAEGAILGSFYAGQDDASTPLGDTPEAHDEISRHDLPLGHPGRQAVESQHE